MPIVWMFQVKIYYGDTEDDDVATADLRKELFEDENIILPTDKNNDHGLGEILENQKKMETQESKEDFKEDLEKLAAMADGMESVSEPPKDPINVD